ncbi:ATPase [Aestuariicella hydrocarbonica]|uniref:ATPase n=1 Tax=Pseudomaricurvus hydrocarbonicus TaxID=1470433 RepID=A0A9E5MM92_9GAMM|nr:ATPase [Aestuariicella hydrocarbonica]NHO65750.1 ATPase [Aestuariicella hydrocarbonica]
MEIETLRDVLDWTRKFHEKLSQCLSNSVDKNSDERARMVMAYLADHEQALAKVIRGFESTGDEDALNTWFNEYVNKTPVLQKVHSKTPFANLNASQIMEVVADQHQQAIELYRYLARRADIDSAQEMLEALLSLEEHEIMRMTQSTNRFSDM